MFHDSYPAPAVEQDALRTPSMDALSDLVAVQASWDVATGNFKWVVNTVVI